LEQHGGHGGKHDGDARADDAVDVGPRKRGHVPETRGSGTPKAPSQGGAPQLDLLHPVPRARRRRPPRGGATTGKRPPPSQGVASRSPPSCALSLVAVAAMGNHSDGNEAVVSSATV
jgi:hypothetical protein